MTELQKQVERIDLFHSVYMSIAITVAMLSYCTKRQVGAVIVRGKNIISYGFNGTVSGTPNVCEDDGGSGRDVHAEMNAVLKAGTACQGADMYVTLYPCETCARMMAQAGIKHVYYLEDHHNNADQVNMYGMHAIKLNTPGNS